MSGFIIGPDPLVLEGNLSKNYEIFESQFNKFYDSKKYLHDLPESEKISFFLTTIGKSAREVYQTFDLSPEDSSFTLKMVMDRFKLYCDSHKDNSVYHSYKFYSRNQHENESFENYLKDIFHMAKPCHFNYDRETIERLVRDKIILGLSNSVIREEIFVKGFSKLDEIVNYCLAREKIDPDPSPGMIPESNPVIKTEKIEDGKDDKDKESEMEIDKNLGNAVTSSNDVLSTPAKPDPGGNEMEVENSEDSVLEKGEVSTSGCGLFVGAPEGQNENSSVSSPKSELEDVKVKQEIMEPLTPTADNLADIVNDSSVCQNITDNRTNTVRDSDTCQNKTDNTETVSDSGSCQNKADKKGIDPCQKAPGNVADVASGSGSCQNKTDKVDINVDSVENKKSPSENSNKEPELITIDSSDDEAEKNRLSNKKMAVEVGNVRNSPAFKNKTIFKCNKCGAVLCEKQEVYTHVESCKVRVNHVNRNIFRCPVCSKVFNNKGSLAAHVVIHRSAKLYNCDLCSKVFDRESKLNSHKAVTHRIKRCNYTCPKCSKSFEDQNILMQHLKEHRTVKSVKTAKPKAGNSSSYDGEGFFKCALCQRNFEDYESLANHKHF